MSDARAAIIFLLLLATPELATGQVSFESDPVWHVSAFGPDTKLGFSANATGDVNGDGFRDIVIGAPGAISLNVSGWNRPGRVYLFMHTPGGYLGTARVLQVTPSSEFADEDRFGFAVATGDVDGDGADEVLVGAPYKNPGAFDAGFVYAFDEMQSGPIWQWSNGQRDARIGFAVASGDFNGDGFDDLVASAPLFDDGETDEGRVFIFYGSAAGLSTVGWVRSANRDSTEFGSALACAGDVNRDGYDDLIIGAGGDDQDDIDAGRLWLYLGGPNGPARPQSRSIGQVGARFGDAVAPAGDVNGDGYADIVVGAPGYGELHPGVDNGAVLVYTGSPSGISTDPFWMAIGDPLSRLGWRVCSPGDVNGDGFSDIAAGSENGSETVRTESVFLGSADTMSTVPEWANYEYNRRNVSMGAANIGDVNDDGLCDLLLTDYRLDSRSGYVSIVQAVPSPQGNLAAEWSVASDGAAFGSALAGAGDVDGDGYYDLLVGDYLSNDTGEAAGSASLFRGRDGGLEAAPDWRVNGTEPFSWFGYSVDWAGDINSDGFDDVIVGAPRYSGAVDGGGRALVFYGSPQGLPATPSWTAYGETAGGNFGSCVARAGDVNGDGYGDVIIAAYLDDSAGPDAGSVRVYLGTDQGLNGIPGWEASGEQPGDEFGFSAACAGDVNHDGYSDIIVGAPGVDIVRARDAGRAYLYLGSPDGLTGPAVTLDIGARERARFGIVCRAAGRVTGDVYGDVLVGAEGHAATLRDLGSVFLFPGRPGGLSPAPVWIASSSAPLDDTFGRAIAPLGDFDGDGFDDFVIGDPLYGDTEGAQGRVLLYRGSSSGPGATPAFVFVGDGAGARLGGAVSCVGDVNGDALPDLAAGAASLQAGAKVTCFGTQNRARGKVVVDQLTADGSSRMSMLDYTGDPQLCRLHIRLALPVAAENLYTEIETKPAGDPFNGLSVRHIRLASLTPERIASGEPLDVVLAVGMLETNWGMHWRVRMVSDSPWFPTSAWVTRSFNPTSEADFRLGSHPAVEPPDPPPAPPSSPDPDYDFELGLNYPNPFNPGTTVPYTLPAAGHVQAVVYDVAGRFVRTLFDGGRDAGDHLLRWDGLGDDGQPLGSGVYFLRFEYAGQLVTRKMIILR